MKTRLDKLTITNSEGVPGIILDASGALGPVVEILSAGDAGTKVHIEVSQNGPKFELVTNGVPRVRIEVNKVTGNASLSMTGADGSSGIVISVSDFGKITSARIPKPK